VVTIQNCVLASGLAQLLLLGACADAPITPDQLEADGRLRARGREQAAFSARRDPDLRPVTKVSAVLSSEPGGALEDRNAFDADVGTVHLHVRADGLLEHREVIYQWAHPDLTVTFEGELAPSDALSLGASLEIDPELVGRWQVEVLTPPASPGEAPRVLFHRDFEVQPVPAAAR
jgi:hypothetical protein